ncbi:flagellin [Celeribacter halophilus]|uniref:Flagellar hook-associated protein 3 FlgL n=1 Tax=Celeribacter halophilus TaxID=576117 RepID=A0A1I3WNC6_9RHOB|nr:flagellin [Celeribacter halophilus]PZX06059.1 flagellar hook-associated protein 3 FlgL [Celeribacter halophilus]SFK08982.1 flagellar hook-associated protein 3 FlgL [Celeribacter halophilus]
MSVISFGDMAASIRNMRVTTQTKLDLEKYGSEVASGEKYDLSTSVSGDFSPLASIERSLRTLQSYDLAIKEADLFATTVQSSLGSISEHVEELSSVLLTASTNGDATSVSVAGTDARTRFDAVVSTLNTRIGNRSLFSGAATGETALISADEMMNDLAAAVAGSTSSSDVETIVDDWFMSPSGGFEMIAYQGSDNALSPFALGEHETVRVDFSANDASLRETLKGLALAALVDEGVLEGSVAEQSSLLRSAGEALMGAQAGLADLRAQVGAVEARIEEASLSNSAMTFSYETAKSEIVSADAYESASMLTQTETQLQIIYTLTSRMSRLSLSDYI